MPKLQNSSITIYLPEGWRAVDRKVSVSLFVTLVLADEVKEVASDDDGSLHLGLGNNTAQNTAADGDIGGEGALLVDVGTFDGLNRIKFEKILEKIKVNVGNCLKIEKISKNG